MGNIFFSYVNDWQSRTITPSSVNPNFPVSYLQNEARSVTYRSALVSSVVTLDVDYGSVPAVEEKIIVASNYNFRSAAAAGAFKFQSDDSAGYGSLVDDVTLAYHARALVHKFTTLKRYQRFRIDDTGQTEGFHELGLLWVGTIYEMDANYNYENIEHVGSLSEVVRNKKTGIAFADQGLIQRRFPLFFEAIEPADRNLLLDLFYAVGTHQPFITVLDYDDLITGDKQRLTIYGRFASEIPFKRLHAFPYDVTIDIIEDAA